jgi:hypothetical protein
MTYAMLDVFRYQIEKSISLREKFAKNLNVNVKDNRLKDILLNLYRILALNVLIHDCGDIYRAGYCYPNANVNMEKA